MEDNDYIVELEIKAREYKKTLDYIEQLVSKESTTPEENEEIIEEIRFLVKDVDYYV